MFCCMCYHCYGSLGVDVIGGLVTAVAVFGLVAGV